MLPLLLLLLLLVFLTTATKGTGKGLRNISTNEGISSLGVLHVRNVSKRHQPEGDGRVVADGTRGV